MSIAPTTQEKREFAGKLREQTVACRVRRAKFGVRRALGTDQIADIAEEFHADSGVLRATKRILDTKDPAWRAVSRLLAQAKSLWKGLTVPYPEPGIRLLRRENIEMFNNQMRAISTQLTEAKASLQEKYGELRNQAREKLGDLFDESDYPTRIDIEFDLDWDFPSIEPPAYLKNLHPELYDQEVERIRGRFEEAVRLTEQAFVEKFHDLVAHLGERLRGDVDGKPKVFQASSIENLNAFFEEFRKLDIGSSSQLSALVDQAQDAVKGIAIDDLRANNHTRERVSEQLNAVMSQIDGMMVARPTRKFNFDDEATPATTEAA